METKNVSKFWTDEERLAFYVEKEKKATTTAQRGYCRRRIFELRNKMNEYEKV